MIRQVLQICNKILEFSFFPEGHMKVVKRLSIFLLCLSLELHLHFQKGYYWLFNIYVDMLDEVIFKVSDP